MNDTNLVQARESSRRLADLLRREHVALADFLVALSAFDRMGAYRRLGFANLFDYLLRELHISRGAAHYRKVAARRFSCWASKRSSAASSTCSSSAPGCTCDWPALAFLSFPTNTLDTVRWSRLIVEVSGSTTVLAGSRAGSGGAAKSSPGSQDPTHLAAAIRL